MLRTRVMPVLLLDGHRLVKTRRFRRPQYVGDPINTARIFNEMEVDELVLLDIGATANQSAIQWALLERIVSECFMPVTYGGGVRALEDFERLFRLGVEKVSVSSLLFDDPGTVSKAVARFGSQSVVATIDVARSRLSGRYAVVTHSGRRRVAGTVPTVVRAVTDLGAGEVIVNNVDREGTWSGFDVSLVAEVSAATDVPVVAVGGAGCLADIRDVVRAGGASAVGLGSMAVFQAKEMGVLVNFPAVAELEELIGT